MTLSASAIISGLTMLRAYNPTLQVAFSDGRLIALHNGFIGAETLHGDDRQRMLSEGWKWSEVSCAWELG